ncbi:MAG: CehA/McbA family metallohydrolase [Dysosmobacter sp.]|mgnify:FL=1|nr:CehA/McbA family metallohydrolase [Dysosmobacter sp.]
MELRLDMHVHSEKSPDGCMTLSEIAERAKRAGLNGAAVCDHDRVQKDMPRFPGFLLIPGVEVSTEYGHLLGLFVTKPVETHDFHEAVELIHGQGGLAVLAHPFERSRDAMRLTPIVPLLDGVEIWNSRAERKIRQANGLAAAFARTHGLRTFAGSDAHRPQEVGNGVTTIEAEALSLEAVKSALLSGQARTSGRRSRAWYTARSQLRKRRRTGAGFASYLKWGAFALKCLMQDVICR